MLHDNGGALAKAMTCYSKFARISEATVCPLPRLRALLGGCACVRSAPAAWRLRENIRLA